MKDLILRVKKAETDIWASATAPQLAEAVEELFGEELMLGFEADFVILFLKKVAEGKKIPEALSETVEALCEEDDDEEVCGKAVGAVHRLIEIARRAPNT